MAGEIEIRVPDIGDFEDVEVVEILVAKGDLVEVEDSLVSLESDKATMEIPSPAAGRIQEVCVELGARVSEGSLLAIMLGEHGAALAATDSPEVSSAVAKGLDGATDRDVPPDLAPVEPPPAETSGPVDEVADDRASLAASPVADRAADATMTSPHRPVDTGTSASLPKPHASPLVRGFARELGVDLVRTEGTGPQGRILDDDVRRYVRDALGGSEGIAPASHGIAPIPAVDFAKFGPVEERPLGRIRRAAAANLTRSWLNLPHVTQHDDADVTALEAFRKSRASEAAERGLKLSPLHFALKAVVIGLREAPDFRSSLSPSGDSLIVKQYYHVGVAVDTEHGLVVPVLRDVDQKGLYQLAEELAELAERARARKLTPAEMQGACFTVSSLGGIGGTKFTPIVNAPEVAILGLSRMRAQPVWSQGVDISGAGGGAFEPRLILPLSLSYDHRVIDGAEAARFTARLCELLSRPTNLLL